jgi:hypothetical protein
MKTDPKKLVRPDTTPRRPGQQRAGVFPAMHGKMIWMAASDRLAHRRHVVCLDGSRRPLQRRAPIET